MTSATTPTEWQSLTEVPLRQIRLARAYYEEFADEIDSALTLADRSLDQLARGYPSIERREVEV